MPQKMKRTLLKTNPSKAHVLKSCRVLSVQRNRLKKKCALFSTITINSIIGAS